jgi:hypothetical protein
MSPADPSIISLPIWGGIPMWGRLPLFAWQASRQHQSMTAGTAVSSAVRRATIAVLAVATAAACVIGATDAANATSTRLQRPQQGFGAAVRIAAGLATATLAPGAVNVRTGQQMLAARVPRMHRGQSLVWFNPATNVRDAPLAPAGGADVIAVIAHL